MKTNKILAGLLILLGFGSCANRAAKSKAANGGDQGQGQTEIKAENDSIAPIRVMYGPPRPRMQPERRIREARPEQTSDSTAYPTATAPAQEESTDK